MYIPRTFSAFVTFENYENFPVPQLHCFPLADDISSHFQIKQESFLEDINNLLNAGEVPNLFPTDEKAEIIEKMRQLDRQRDKTRQTDGTPVALFNMFVQRCRDQLHIVLAMSPIGDAFRNRLRKFPSLVNCCTIDWFQVRAAAYLGEGGTL